MVNCRGDGCIVASYYYNFSITRQVNRTLLLVLILTIVISSCSSMASISSTKRVPTLRSITSSISSISDTTEKNDNDLMAEHTKQMVARAKEGKPLTEDELSDISNSLQNICPKDSNIDFDELREILKTVAHLSHKDWSRTSNNSDKLSKVLLQENGMDNHARQMLERILEEGNWDGAAEHAKSCKTPWAVLVTGVNGIRKTTSIYQPWFPQLLEEALVAPPGSASSIPLNALPCGSNSFFRQLDHMIATLCNEDFMKLYALTAAKLDDPKDIPTSVVRKYSDLKAAIFTRYRTLSELLGALLLKQAQTVELNCMLETSGRDVAMFHYVDHFFASAVEAEDNDNKKRKGLCYNKLALHFTINDLSFAQKSVDSRMVKEIRTGVEAVESNDVFNIIYANAGGPYGSEVLPEVQEASDQVWDEVVMKGDTVGQDWYKATIAINAHGTEPWTAQAVKPDGTLGTKFTFEPQK